MTHASRNTTTGLDFEAQVVVAKKDGIDLSKRKLQSWCKSHGVSDITEYLSWAFQPDEAYYLPSSNEVIIYEKKSQHCSGSADEKLGNCAWKIGEYKNLFTACGVSKVSYIFIFNDWFKQNRYVKLLKYIKSVPGCDYFFFEQFMGSNGRRCPQLVAFI